MTISKELSEYRKSHARKLKELIEVSGEEIEPVSDEELVRELLEVTF